MNEPNLHVFKGHWPGVIILTQTSACSDSSGIDNSLYMLQEILATCGFLLCWVFFFAWLGNLCPQFLVSVISPFNHLGKVILMTRKLTHFDIV